MGLLMARKMYNTKFVTTKSAATNVVGDEMQFTVIRIIELWCITFVCQQNHRTVVHHVCVSAES